MMMRVPFQFYKYFKLLVERKLLAKSHLRGGSCSPGEMKSSVSGPSTQNQPIASGDAQSAARVEQTLPPGPASP